MSDDQRKSRILKVLVLGPDRDDPGGVANYYNAVFPRLSGDGVEAHYLEIGSTHGGKSRLHIIGDQLRLWNTIGRLKPDIVHLNPSLVTRSFFRDGLFIFQAKLRGCKVLVFFRGWQVSFERLVTRKLGWFFRFTYRKADEFIVLASSFSDTLVKWGVEVPIHLGTTVVCDENLEGFSIDSKVHEVKTAEQFKLLFLARLEWEKGIIDLIQAVMGLLDQGHRLELTIAGDGPAMSEIRGMIAEKKLYGECIRVVGYVRGQDKLDIFHSHHIFCLPSEYAEGMPNSIMEAMGFGMPVITCPVGGIADFFEDGVMGVLIRNRSVQAVSEAIELLTSDPEKVAEIAHYNHDYAMRRFLASTGAGMLRKRYLELNCNA